MSALCVRVYVCARVRACTCAHVYPQEWERDNKDGKIRSPREDVNCPDLYLPCEWCWLPDVDNDAVAGVGCGSMFCTTPSRHTSPFGLHAMQRCALYD